MSAFFISKRNEIVNFVVVVDGIVFRVSVSGFFSRNLFQDSIPGFSSWILCGWD